MDKQDPNNETQPLKLQEIATNKKQMKGLTTSFMTNHVITTTKELKDTSKAIKKIRHIHPELCLAGLRQHHYAINDNVNHHKTLHHVTIRAFSGNIITEE